MMIKNWMLAVALLTLAFCLACSNTKNGGGGGGGVQVSVSPSGQAVGVTLTQQFTANVSGTSNKAVTWSVSGSGCTGAACGSIDTNGKYTAPNVSPNPAQVTVTATSQADSSKSDSATVNVVNITVSVTPSPADVGTSFTQQFAAIAVPDAAPQTFTWTVTCTSGNCGSVVPDANDATVAVYTAPPGPPNPANSVRVTATSTVDATNNPKVGQASVTVVNLRIPGGTYAFRFSGFNITGAPIAMVGNFKVASNGTISGGDEDDLAPGPAHHIIDNSSSITMNSNNQGTLTLHASGPTSNTYIMVLDASGDIQMIESTSDGTSRRGSGVIEPAAPSKFNNAALLGNFVFGFTGADLAGKRVGYVGLLPMDGNGNITGGLLDTNDNGGGTNGTPLSVSGTYSVGSTGMGTMTLTSGSRTFNFSFYVVGGASNASTPLTLYAASTDAVAANPAVSGTVIFQDPTPTYDIGALNKTMVASLTGVDSTGTNSDVALLLATPDGGGHVSGTFDQNNGGTIASAQSFSTGYTYSASSCVCGRYTMSLLGNPSATPPAPMQFVFYATAANRGFLLDQSSASVLTGTMDQQKGNNYAPSELPGVFAASSLSSGTKDVSPSVADMLLTSPGNSVFNVAGTRFVSGASGSQSLAGSYTLMSTGVGTLALTAPATENYVIYVLDNTPGQVVHRFLMMNVDAATTDPSIISAQQ